MGDAAAAGAPGDPAAPDAPGAGAPAPARASAALVAGAALLAHLTALAADFQFDDWNVVVNDPRVASLDAWWRSLPAIRPLLKLVWAAGHASGLGPAGFHAVNVAVHVASALLVLALLRLLEARAPGGEAAAGRAATVGALLFALHPAQTEAVAYVSGGATALAAALALASAVAWLDGREAGRRSATHVLSPALLALSLGVKELGVVLPVALVLLEAADARRPFRWRAALAATWVHGLVAAAALAAFAAAPAYRAMIRHALGLRPPLENLRVHLDGLAWLAGQALRPDLLVADPPAPGPGWLRPALAAAALLAAAAFGLAALRRRPAALAALWTVLWLPATGFWLPRPEPASDRQLYLALAGPAWLAGRWLAAGGRARTALAAALVVALGAATAARGLVYRDEVTFWADAARKVPENGRAFSNLGYALARCGRDADAAAAFRRALALDPRDFRAGANLRLLREGELVSPEERARARCPPPPE